MAPPRNEVSALLEVAGEAVERLAIGPAQGLHRAVAGRVFGALGPLAAPVRGAHDGISGIVYAAVRGAARAGFAAAAAGVRAGAGGAEVRPLSRTRRGRLAVGAVNALLGDRLDARGSDLAIAMSVRAGGRDLPCARGELEKAFPAAGARIAVFLHGLGENEELWSPALAGEPGLTRLFVRYNSGLHVSDNGRRLAALLEALLAAWPVAGADLVLVGHSMGGLVARSACHAGTLAGHTWPARVRHLITLGTPHTGAPLEKAVHALAWALGKLPETRPLAAILDQRSAGIRDLRFGYLLDDEWAAERGDRLFDDRRLEVPLLPGCRYTFVTATLTRDPDHLVGRLAGDLLVRTASAGGRHRARSIPVPPDAVVHLGPLTHFDLLHHPLVDARLRSLLTQ